MKFLLSSLLAVIVLGSAPGVKAAQIWVNGVTTESGWIDYDKSWDGDTLLCWAASASCVLDYWQSLYLTSSTVPTGAAIWERYKEAADDKLGNALLGIQWWIGGDYAGTTIKDNDQTNNRAEYMILDSIAEATANAIREGMLAFIRPVITSAEGRWVAIIR